MAAAQTLYWDTNGSTAGAGASPSATWSTSNSDKNWTASSAGTSSGVVTWTSGGDAVFSAGTDATGNYAVSLSGTQNVSSITVQEGSPTFSGGTFNFSDATPDLTVNPGATLNWGATALTSVTNTLNIGGGGLVNLALSGTFNGTINFSGGTLRLTNSTLGVGTLNITGNTTIDFAGSASTLNLSNLTISAGVTLNITNWANATDYFYASNWTGATFDTTGTAPMNRVLFNGFTASNTRWQGYDHQVTPVPEPAFSGAFLLGVLGAVFVWRRRHAPRDA